jgi:predicted acyltransferase
MGALAGAYLRDKQLTQYRKVIYLASAGIVLILLGAALHPVYPVIKAAWTTTFNFLAGGICLVLLALFYLIIDVWKVRRWSYFFRVIGMNSITIYMGVRIIDFKHTSDFFLNGLASYAGNFEPVVLFLGMILVEWLFLYYLYKNKIFLRV